MSGRAATDSVIVGRCAVSVGDPRLPLPKGWVWAPLADVARLESGHTPSREHPEYWGGDIGWIGIKDARAHDGGEIHETFQSVTAEGISNSAARVLPAQTVCLSRTASVGYTVIMGRPMATSQDFVNWVCSDAMAPRFLQYALIGEGREGLKQFGEGTTHTTIYYPEVKAFHVAMPPPREQRRIVAKLDDLRARSRRARQALDEVPALLDQLKQSILAAAFRGDLTADWRAAHPNAEPASVLLERIRAERRRRWEEANPRKAYVEPEAVDAEGLPELPEGWAWATLAAVADVIDPNPSHRNPEYVRHGYPFVSTADFIGEDGIDLNTANRVSERTVLDQEGRCDLDERTVLFSRKGTIGKTRLFPGGVRMALLDSLCVIKPTLGVEASFLCLCLRSWMVTRQVDGATRGVAIRQISVGRVRDLRIPVPPFQEQVMLARRLTHTLSDLQVVGESCRTSNGDLNTLDQSILARAFRGELVPQDPADEPADALLARLRSSAPPARKRSPRSS